MIYVTGMDIVLKQIIKRLIFLILLKNFNERRIQYSMKKTDNLRIT